METTPTHTIRISSNAFSDHTSRLYDDNCQHIDMAGCWYKLISSNTKTVTIEITENAIKEFIADMDYQVEFCDDYSQRDYRNQCKRALASILKQLEKKTAR